MSPTRSAKRDLGRFGWLQWLGDWRAVWLLTAAFVALGAEAIAAGRYLHDEGVLTYYFAGIVGEAPLAGLFFQKLRPVLALAYAPIAPLGYTAFAVAHLLVAATAIPLAAAVSRHLGHRFFAIPAAVIATSPLMAITAASGHSNSDAVVGILLGLYLIVVRGRSFGGGAVLGAMLMVRSEVAPIVLFVALERAWSGDRRVLMGLPAVVIAYAIPGALYHRDPLWMLHYPPSLAGPAPDTHWIEGGALASSLGESLLALLCLTPVVGLVVLVRRGSLGSLERGLGLGLLAFVLAIRGFPMIGLFNFDTSPRYLLAGLPALALLVGRHCDASVEESAAARDGGSMAIATLVLLGLVAFAADDRAGVLLSAVGLWVVCWAQIRFFAPPQGAAAAIGTWLAAAIITFPAWLGHTRLLPPTEPLDRIESWWRDAGVPDDIPVLTNFRLLKPSLVQRGVDVGAGGSRVHLLVQHDMRFELETLLHAEVGQRAAVFAAMDRHFYGKPLVDVGLPDRWPAGTVVVLDLRDDRLSATVDLEAWRAALILEVDGGPKGVSIFRLRGAT